VTIRWAKLVNLEDERDFDFSTNETVARGRPAEND
jgi:hypothetical protein